MWNTNRQGTITATWTAAKYNKILLQNVSGLLLKNEVFHKMLIIKIILICNCFIAKCHLYYKRRRCTRLNFVSTEVILIFTEETSSLYMESDSHSTQDVLTCNLVPRAILNNIALGPHDFAGSFFLIWL